MSVGILTALKTFKEHPYVQYVGIGLAGLANTLAADADERGPESHRKRKSKLQLIRLSTAVCGIELCYAAETAFVSPILLKLGVPVSLMTLVWCLSPMLGFFLVPLMGSLSDRCPAKLGRRRPFILFMSAGIVLGLLLVPNGEALGITLGDNGTQSVNYVPESLNTTPVNHANYTYFNDVSTLPSTTEDSSKVINFHISREHVRGIIFTIVGVVILDFNCDACQSPCRTYLLDVSIPADHSAGLTMFTVMAGLGGSVGYIMGGIDWNSTDFGAAFGGHIRVVFFLVLIVFIVCLISTVTSFTETPLKELGISQEQIQKKKKKIGKSKYRKFVNEDDNEEEEVGFSRESSYGAISHAGADNTADNKDLQNGYIAYDSKEVKPDGIIPNGIKHLDQGSSTESASDVTTTSTSQQAVQLAESGSANTKLPCQKTTTETLDMTIEVSTDITLKTYLTSIIKMPREMLVLCLTNLFCWMSLLCYSLYFTDFVGQSVFGGDPRAPTGSDAHNQYDDGVRLGSFGMSLYSLSCALYSLCVEKLVQRFRAKRLYVCGQLTYSVGMVILAISRHKMAVVILSATAGIMYATLFTMPYLLVAQYHTCGMFSQGRLTSKDQQVRGLGTDVAVVGSMVFLAQFLLSVSIGSVIQAVNSTVAVVVAAAILSFCGAVTATQVTYLDL
ncbi:proton-associated sugar transporter A-like [Gigantopelta aegis]|uniref:proton-associated sugar transporter A-like n=1 Tax=Gigantopelta aegis TaxID=1735272 RepID=UPI001B88DED2|nr:proton-associated sugar transporter A-like [Gigantopelta aegis]